MKNHKIIKTLIIFLLITLSASYNAVSNNNSKTIYVDIDGGKEYKSIKNAIENATSGDTVFIYNGIYYEYLTINKSINLIGENKEKTIIQHNISKYDNYLIKITADNVKISGFKIKGSIYNTAENNPILPLPNDYSGIIIESDNNEIKNNNIYDNLGYGLILNNSENTILSNNTITKCYTSGIYLKNSSKNIISNNNITNNNIGITFFLNSIDNILYHNNFINNTYYHILSEDNNIFYNYTLKQGNYYDDYHGTDKNNDGIGDTPYNISGEKYKDLYPIMSPYNGRIVIKEFYVDQDAVIFMLWIAMIITIVFLIPIAYIWYRKTRPYK